MKVLISPIKVPLIASEAPDEEAISDIALEALEAELPALTVLRDFANRASRVSWFTELGEPLMTTASTW